MNGEREGGVRCHMSLSGRPIVPGPACLFSLSSEDGFTRRRLAQMAGRTRRAGGCTHARMRRRAPVEDVPAVHLQFERNGCELDLFCEIQRQRFMKRCLW